MIPEALIAYRKAGGVEYAFTEGAPGYFQLWPEDEIHQWNTDYQVPEYAPGFTGFGSDGGGEMLAFDHTGAIYMIPFIDMSPEDAQKIAESWPEIANRIKNEKCA